MKLKNLIAGVCALCGGAVSAQAETVEYWDPVGKVTEAADASAASPPDSSACRSAGRMKSSRDIG